MLRKQPVPPNVACSWTLLLIHIYLTPTSPFISNPSSLHNVHPALSHVGPVGPMNDVQIVSVAKNKWEHVSDEVLVSFADKDGVLKVEIQKEPKMSVNKANTGQHRFCEMFASAACRRRRSVPIHISTFLARLKSLYPTGHDNPWYIIAAVGFSAANRPEAVPDVLKQALKEIEGGSQDDKLLIVRRLRDALFKAGLINGYPRTINALKAMLEATPEDLRDTQPLRDVSLPITEFAEQGREFFRRTYGDTADAVQELLTAIYPDMGWFTESGAYGLVYSYSSVLTPVETSFVLCSALIAMDATLETVWHLKGAGRNGASFEELDAVRTMAMEVAKESGVVLRNLVPEIEKY